MTVQELLDELGGEAFVARVLGLSIQTVASWGDRNSIPKWRMDGVLGIAADQGKQVPESFATPLPRASDARAA